MCRLHNSKKTMLPMLPVNLTAMNKDLTITITSDAIVAAPHHKAEFVYIHIIKHLGITWCNARLQGNWKGSRFMFSWAISDGSFLQQQLVWILITENKTKINGEVYPNL